MGVVPLLQGWTSIGTFIAALAGLVSLLFGLFSWTFDRRRNRLKTVRNDLSNVRVGANVYLEGISDLAAIEVGNLAAIWIVEQSEAKTGHDITDFIKTADFDQLFLGSIIFGNNESSLQASQRRAVALMRESSGRHKEDFPITSYLFEVIGIFYSRMADIEPLAVQIKQWRDDGTVPRQMLGDIKEGDTRGTMKFRIADHFAQMVASRTHSDAQAAKYLAELVGIVTGNYLYRTDAKLALAARKERSERAELSAIRSEKISTQVSDLLDLIRPLFSDSEWTRLVELRTKFHDHYEKEE